jgi:hypothetical protein
VKYLIIESINAISQDRSTNIKPKTIAKSNMVDVRATVSCAFEKKENVEIFKVLIKTKANQTKVTVIAAKLF